jgi:site-specific DNA-cytosine methylase
MVQEVQMVQEEIVQQATISDVSHVYWIKHKSHTDVFTEGYVGVTATTPDERFKKHMIVVNSSSNKKKYLVHHKIKSHGVENIEVVTILISDKQYCYDIEKKLRPRSNIAWNLSVGGIIPAKKMPYVISQETRAKLSKAAKGRKLSEEHKRKIGEKSRNRVHSEECRRKLSEGMKGRTFSKETLKKMSEGSKGKFHTEESKIRMKNKIAQLSYWDKPRSHKRIWEYADVFYLKFLEGKGSYATASSYLDICTNSSSLIGMWKHFKQGWIPNQDEKWLSDFNKQEGI